MHRMATIAMLGLALLATPAVADKPDHAGKGKGKSKGDDAHHDSGGDVVVVFSSGQRSGYQDWWVREYGRGHCPPGLAKKHNGCLPPGQAKKRYAVGAPLPPGIVIGVVPPSLGVILGPPPSGYRYGIVDGDVVKLAVGTLLVVDAIEGLLN